MQRSKQPLMILSCQHNSHYFEERNIVVNDVVKVGRAVARAKAAPNNAIFDCKVLSRNHAIIWFSSDEFWLRDTNSSNGTFVNDVRVTKRDDSDSCDRQIFSGDIIRFGVDVVENDTTHGCIITSVTLILPNGCEAKPNLGHSSSESAPASHIPINTEQIFQLSCYLNDTLFREQALEKRLENLRTALHDAQLASEAGWQAMLNEEKLLEKLDLYENQMRIFKEDLSEDSLKARLSEAFEQKSLQENAYKSKLNQLLKEKSEALQKVQELERSLLDLQSECTHLRDNYTAAQNAYTALSTDFKKSVSEVTQRLSETTTERDQLSEQFAHVNENNKLLQLQVEQLFSELNHTKELRERENLGIPNGLAEPEMGREVPSTSNDLGAEDEVLEQLNLAIDSVATRPAENVSSSPLPLSMNKEADSSTVTENLSQSIYNFHQSLRLIRMLKDKILVSTTTDLDHALPADLKGGDEQSLLTKSVDNFVNEILRYHENALANLHAYFLQVNPSAAVELAKTIHKSIETSNESRIQRDFVEVVGADSSGTHSSPTVSSNGPNMSPSSEIASSNAEEVVTLRESMRLAIEKISHYEAILANVEASVQQKNSQNDAAKEQAILTAREECDALRSQVSNFEEQLREVRENHRRLIEEARQHRSEVQLLREERDRLEASLLEIRRKNECLQYNSPLRPAMNASSVSRSVQDDSANETERLELLPRRLVTVSSLTAIPLMVLLFAVMFAIFSKFVG
uniref:FHA domain-containing protein n=1 Tax=Schistocephalus solidus TaxID=70667 RepID=A0A0X3PY78_SCHSO